MLTAAHSTMLLPSEEDPVLRRACSPRLECLLATREKSAERGEEILSDEAEKEKVFGPCAHATQTLIGRGADFAEKGDDGVPSSIRSFFCGEVRGGGVSDLAFCGHRCRSPLSRAVLSLISASSEFSCVRHLMGRGRLPNKASRDDKNTELEGRKEGG